MLWMNIFERLYSIALMVIVGRLLTPIMIGEVVKWPFKLEEIFSIRTNMRAAFISTMCADLVRATRVLIPDLIIRVDHFLFLLVLWQSEYTRLLPWVLCTWRFLDIRTEVKFIIYIFFVFKSNDKLSDTETCWRVENIFTSKILAGLLCFKESVLFEISEVR